MWMENLTWFCFCCFSFFSHWRRWLFFRRVSSSPPTVSMNNHNTLLWNICVDTRLWKYYDTLTIWQTYRKRMKIADLRQFIQHVINYERNFFCTFFKVCRSNDDRCCHCCRRHHLREKIRQFYLSFSVENVVIGHFSWKFRSHHIFTSTSQPTKHCFRYFICLAFWEVYFYFIA